MIYWTIIHDHHHDHQHGDAMYVGMNDDDGGRTGELQSSELLYYEMMN